MALTGGGPDHPARHVAVKTFAVGGLERFFHAAIFAGVVAGGRRLVRIALTCNDSSGTLIAKIAPCGACLQVIAEFGTADTAIVIDGRGTFRLTDFLPLPFGADTLKAHDGVTG